MAKPEVTQTHFIQYFEFLRDLRNVAKEKQRLADGHLEDLVDVFASVENFQNPALVSSSLAVLANQFDVREKLHFDGDRSIALACLATAAWNIE